MKKNKSWDLFICMLMWFAALGLALYSASAHEWIWMVANLLIMATADINFTVIKKYKDIV